MLWPKVTEWSTECLTECKEKDEMPILGKHAQLFQIWYQKHRRSTKSTIIHQRYFGDLDDFSQWKHLQQVNQTKAY